jgi:hypothetical protein
MRIAAEAMVAMNFDIIGDTCCLTAMPFCCAAYQQMLPWRSNTAANHTESAASAATAC